MHSIVSPRKGLALYSVGKHGNWTKADEYCLLLAETEIVLRASTRCSVLAQHRKFSASALGFATKKCAARKPRDGRAPLIDLRNIEKSRAMPGLSTEASCVPLAGQKTE